MSEFWSLLFGVLLLLTLMVVATKGWLASRELHEPVLGPNDEETAKPCPEEFAFRIFSRADWEFVRGLKARRIEQLFARERKKAALIWIRQSSGMIRKAMREHAAAARQSKNLKLSSEVNILAQFLTLIVACGILSMAIQIAGPVRLSGLAHVAQRLSQQVTRLQESFEAGVLEKGGGPGIA